MRLLKLSSTGRISFTDDLRTNIPKYAILSHTWGADGEEVTYNDIINRVALQKPGYSKIKFCIDRVQKDKLRHFWIDTCCIDKSNLPELSEAITSMFRWYKNAVKCYVFLSDIHSRRQDYNGNLTVCDPSLHCSRWFTRGWTLQELIAPPIVEFYSSEGDCLGNKESLALKIQEITTIPVRALSGVDLDEFAPREKIRWAHRRDTTREEDKAYCLQGIFGVYILPNYGEKENAYYRLCDEIGRAIPHQLKQNIPSASTGRSEASTLQKRSSSLEVGLNMSHWKTLLASLEFSDMDTRLLSIRSACSTTCHWLLETPAWQDWINNDKMARHYGFFWMYGKPGAGKSTTMKFAYHHAVRESLRDEIVLCFFFNARGDRLEKSTLGMYRALLHQLLCIEAAYAMFKDIAFPTKFTGQFYPWTINSLCGVLHDVILRLVVGPVETGQSQGRDLKLFIDALDECTESEVQEMVRWFEDLGMECVNRGGRLRVCFASRHYPTIDPGPGIRMNLELESGHEGDLAIYIRRYLRSNDPQIDIEELQQNVQRKARGVFFWVILVVDILGKEIKNGRVHTLKRRLQEIPGELRDLLQDIIQRDGDNMAEFKFCLQLILFTKRPLTDQEFYLAMLVGTGADVQSALPSVSRDSLLRFILSSSKGLAELTRSKKAPKVQFIHESVKDYLIKDRGLLRLWPDLGTEVEQVSHDQLRQCCEDYLGLVSAALPLEDQAMLMLTDLHPFMEYATQCVLYHAEIAAMAADQSSFLARFKCRNWILLHNALKTRKSHCYPQGSDLSYILAAESCPRLLQLRGNFDLWARTKTAARYATPFCFALTAALVRHDKDVAMVLLTQNGVADHVAVQLSMPRRGRLCSTTAPLAALCHGDNAAIVMALLTRPTCHERHDMRLVAAAMEGGHHELVDVLFPDVVLHLKHYYAESCAMNTILMYTCELGQDDRVRRILDEGSKRFWETSSFREFLVLLTIAVKNSHITTIKILLDDALSKLHCDVRPERKQIMDILAELQLGSTEITQLLARPRS